MARTTIPGGEPVLAVDVGGTAIKAAYLDADGTLSATSRTLTPQPGPAHLERLVDAIVSLTETVPAGRPVRALGLGVPGIVDEDRGIAVYSENLDWRDLDLVGELSKRLPYPVFLTHDVRAAALAETRLGAAASRSDVAVVVIGTGVAAGLVLGGVPFAGRGLTGEIGHAVVVPGGEPCVCGNNGCLETVSSAAAIARRYSTASGTPTHGAHEVLHRALEGEELARRIWDEAVDALAISLSHLTAAVGPEAIVLGGGLSEAGDHLLVPLRERLAHHFKLPLPELVRADLGEDAGVIGAALVARDRLT